MSIGINEEEWKRNYESTIGERLDKDVKSYDPVNHPSHYCQPGQLESIEKMEVIFGIPFTKHFCLLNAYKYIERCEHKGCFEQDLKKAIWYLRRLASYICCEEKLTPYLSLSYSGQYKTKAYLFSAQVELSRIELRNSTEILDTDAMHIGLAIGYLKQAIENGVKGESLEA